MEVTPTVFPAIPPSLFQGGPSAGAACRFSSSHGSSQQDVTHASCSASACQHRDLVPPAVSDLVGFDSSTVSLPSETTLEETLPLTQISVFDLAQVNATAPSQPVASPTVSTVMASGGPRRDSHSVPALPCRAQSLSWLLSLEHLLLDHQRCSYTQKSLSSCSETEAVIVAPLLT